MSHELMLSAFLMAVGLSVAGVGTHLYQMVWRVPAMLSYHGSTFFASMGHLVVSFVCGPYIMLRMGVQAEEEGGISLVSVLIAAFVAFGWAFITGMLFVGGYMAVFIN